MRTIWTIQDHIMSQLQDFLELDCGCQECLFERIVSESDDEDNVNGFPNCT